MGNHSLTMYSGNIILNLETNTPKAYEWIKECVGTATASVLVNGSPTDEFPLERGLRQGDPLSPFLFLLAEGLNVLMQALVDAGMFTGYSVGRTALVVVSHLQFADNTILIGNKSWANVRALRAGLVLFEAMSELKVNFHKSSLVGVNINDSWFSEAASMLGCKVDREALWRKVLVARYGVADGGLEDGDLEDGGRSCSSWWREIVRIRDGICEGGEGWFGACVRRRVGDGAKIDFWRDRWCGDVPLCDRFSRLYDLAVNKSITVRNMFLLGVDVGGEALRWRRRLWAWEEELVEECRVVLLTVSLKSDK
ncbi:uncharacterized protein [Medicago truncatula]|uniref:uncharacterized protein n=1 Tax=Medicago truncatula TaxID=3880 RepID=UPI000D2F325D|nr:uncharacterized protein LOC112422836 [Medicago truncatula]